MTATRSAHLTSFRGEPAVTLAAGELEATFLPSLSMLGVSLRHRGDELLAPVKALARYRAGRVTGIPFLYPWANRLGAWRYEAAGRHVDVAPDVPVDRNGLPMHGTVASLPFEVVRLVGGRLTAALDSTEYERITTSFPFPHVVELDVLLDDGTLTIATTVRATGPVAVPISFGFHPYFRLPGAPRRSWRFRLPPRGHLALDDRQLPTGELTGEPAQDEPIASHTFDDHYRLGDDRRFEVEAGDRKLIVTFDQGFEYAQLYAPPRAGFVCIEPMTAPVNALVDGTAPMVQPGGLYRAAWQVSVT
ncbi:MAG: aldose 1-epimerase [Actinomycetota bacterium]|nr:aldose 1-epimerase [Actinomycetota bacterium]